MIYDAKKTMILQKMYRYFSMYVKTIAKLCMKKLPSKSLRSITFYWNYKLYSATSNMEPCDNAISRPLHSEGRSVHIHPSDRRHTFTNWFLRLQTAYRLIDVLFQFEVLKGNYRPLKTHLHAAVHFLTWNYLRPYTRRDSEMRPYELKTSKQ